MIIISLFKKHLYSILLVVLGLCCSTMGFASTEKKVALIIGNSQYQTGTPLKNPVNDAKDVSQKLQKLGFKTFVYHDLSLSQMVHAVDRFKIAAENSDAAIFYYAGHGIEIQRQNFLIPIDAKMETERTATYEALRMSDVVEVMRQANIRNGLIILDACRDNPFLNISRSGSRGLARYPESNLSNLMIIYAAQAGQIAKDGDGRNGVFTTQFLKYVDEPNLAVPQLFNKIKLGVSTATNNVQQIYQEGDILANFVFNPVALPAMIESPFNAELKLWNQIKDSNSIAAFNDYLKKYPAGQFVELARLKINPPALSTSINKNQDCADCPELVQLSASRSQNGQQYPLLMGRYEVTRKEFMRFVEDTNYKIDQEGCYTQNEGIWRKDTNYSFLNPGFIQNENHPVTCVSWLDANKYIEWLNKKTGKKYRLPTAEEWQYAASAGIAQNQQKSCPDTIQANFNGKVKTAGCNPVNRQFLQRTSNVGHYPANNFGLHDMLGNLAEWTASCDENVSVGLFKRSNKNSSCKSDHYILKGGSWLDTANFINTVGTVSNDAKIRNFNYGFRIVRNYE